MLPHPYSYSTQSKATGIVLLLFIAAAQWGLLVYYCSATPTAAVVDSLLYTGLLAIAGYMAWYALSFIRIWQAQAFIAVLIQVVSLGLCFLLLTVLKAEETDVFIKSIPFRFLFGLLLWTILLQWYWLLQKTDKLETELAERAMETQVAPECIDRITVKDGSRIHIVHLAELHCIQASGDYVMLCTPTGQYIKEQTMKYFETNLPTTFVRIHRSVIVNTEYIQRVELFGKETYQVRLKNGQSLRASNAGYKLLKERLQL